MHLSVTGLQTLIDNLLESIQIEAGRFSISPRTTDLDRIITEAKRIMSPLFTRRQQALNILKPEGLPQVYCDPTRITQVLVNFLSNASKYGPTQQEILINVIPADNNWLKVSVTDHGPGIPEPETRKNIPAILPAWCKVQCTGWGGIGIVGGTRNNRTAWWGCRCRRSARRRFNVLVHNSFCRVDFMKALVVDDDFALSDVLSFTMRRAGFQVITAHDGKEALDLWQSESPDLIILDLNLPKLDGFSVCKWIRTRSDVPIIILSVRSDEEDVVDGLKLGADDYLVKPFSPRELVARADAVFKEG